MGLGDPTLARLAWLSPTSWELESGITRKSSSSCASSATQTVITSMVLNVHLNCKAALDLGVLPGVTSQS